MNKPALSPFNWRDAPRQTKDEPVRYVPPAKMDQGKRFHIYSKAGVK